MHNRECSYSYLDSTSLRAQERELSVAVGAINFAYIVTQVGYRLSSPPSALDFLILFF